ncbi:metal ABC transporter ATP-binding protein [candidate division WOR-3 bacterium]|nr:metal ABC transporter ATP-binding protein [candidate division WOR-3 bacterium]
MAVVGPNGAGKTTLLTLINGLGRLQHGAVTILGERITWRNINSIRSNIGYVPQHLSIDPRMPVSVYDVVVLGRYPRIGLFRNPAAEDHRIARAICERVGISDLMSKPVGHLSGGESQKVSLARALAQQPHILLLDEPTANLDMRARKEIMDVIEDVYRKDAITVLFVTHVLSHLPGVCSDAVLLKHGRIVAQGSVSRVLSKERLSDVYEYPAEMARTTEGA